MAKILEKRRNFIIFVEYIILLVLYFDMAGDIRVII